MKIKYINNRNKFYNYFISVFIERLNKKCEKFVPLIMLYARKNIKKNNVQMYILLLNDFISHKNEKVKPLFISLYEDTKAIIEKDKTFYNIENRDFVPLVAYLVNNHSDYFKNIDLRELNKDKEHFAQLKSYLEKAATII